jgi:hypothetical protein
MCHLLVGAVLVLVLAACESDNSTIDATGSATSATATGPSAVTVTSAGGSVTAAVPPTTAEPATAAPSDGNDSVDYMQWGPDDPLIPGQYGALAAATGQPPDCDRVDDQKPNDDAFWSTVVAVCRALTAKGEWPATVPPAPAASNKFQDCLNGELSGMMHSALKWHEAHPDAKPKVSYPKASAHSKCLLRIYETNVSAANEQDHPGGGVLVELYVPGLNNNGNDPAVRIDGKAVDIDQGFGGGNDGLSNGQVFVPAPVKKHQANVEVDTPFGTLSTKVDLPKVDAASSSTTSTDTTDGTDTTPDSSSTTTS